jgi:hypothetical protein
VAAHRRQLLRGQPAREPFGVRGQVQAENDRDRGQGRRHRHLSLLGSPGANDRWIEVGSSGIPGRPAADQMLGASLHFTGTRLYVGMPYGPSAYGALDALPLPNVTAGATNAAITTYQPGQGGLPAAGARFGYAAR